MAGIYLRKGMVARAPGAGAIDRTVAPDIHEQIKR